MNWGNGKWSTAWKTVALATCSAMVITVWPMGAGQAEAASFNMSYLYFGSGDTMLNQLANTKGALNVASPSYFDLHEDGTLKMTSLFSLEAVKRMQAMGVKVVPFLSNHWDRKSGELALDQREALANELARVITLYGLDGVNVDIENVSETHRAKYTDFVRLLREKLPADKEVSVAVAANPNGWTKGWHGSYDYAELAKHADYLMLMAYDESFQGGPEGPVASIGWVERSIQYALQQSVPAEKLVLGLAFFGRYWLQGSTSRSHLGMGVSNSRIAAMVERYGGTVSFDEKSASPKAVFTIRSGDPETQVAGRTLPVGTYHVYYENNASLKRKVELVHKYGLKGTGSWSLGQEEASLWDEFPLWIAAAGEEPAQPVTPTPAPVPMPVPVPSPTPVVKPPTPVPAPVPQATFTDIASHWASGSIREAYARGWINGKSAARFAPDESLTRAEASALLVRMLELEPTSTLGQPFHDVPRSHWAHAAVATAQQHGLLQGTGESQFSPDAPMTREQMAVLLDRVITERAATASASVAPLARTAASAPRFADLASARWSQPAVTRMAQRGVLTGYSDGRFRPEQPLTRAETTALLLRTAAQLKAPAHLLRHGMESAEVSALQEQLAELGYFDHAVTGYFGDITQAAVEAFQQDHGLHVDGIVGPQTASKLEAILAAPRS